MLGFEKVQAYLKKMENKCNNCNNWCKCKNMALMIARIVLAVIFISNGLYKIMHPEAVTTLFTGLFGGSGVAILYIVGLLETLAGLMMLGGIMVSYAAIVIMFFTIVSGILKITGQIPGNFNSAFNSEFSLLALAFMVATFGAGTWVMMHHKDGCGCDCKKMNGGNNCSDGTCGRSSCGTCSK